jgi:hypothetical protein
VGQEDKIETEDSLIPALCHVQDCEWERYVEFEDMARTLEVLHIVVQHPQFYYQTTGNNPFEAQRRYQTMINACRRWL